MGNLIKRLKDEAASHGDKLSMLAFSRLPEVKAGFDSRGIKISPNFNFAPSREGGWASVILIASPSKRFSVSFNLDGVEFTAVIPPAYCDDVKSCSAAKTYLGELLEKEGWHIKDGSGLPCKAIAAHTGIGVYGRNNIIFTKEYGSCINLNIFFTDLPCEDESFYPFALNDLCNNCGNCVKNCPTGALSSERFTVKPERCLCRINEHEEEFPDWLDPSWHHAIIGCEMCQNVCPLNGGVFKNAEEIARFDSGQTTAFLRGELPDEALAPLGIKYFNSVLPRNLNCLLQKR